MRCKICNKKKTIFDFSFVVNECGSCSDLQLDIAYFLERTGTVLNKSIGTKIEKLLYEIKQWEKELKK